MNDKIRIGVLGASGYTGADLVRLALLHPRDGDHGADRQHPCRQDHGRGLPASRLRRAAAPHHGRGRRLGRRRCGLLRPAARHDPGDHQVGARPAPEDQVHRHVGRLPAARSRDLQDLVRPRPSGDGPAGRGGLRPHRALPRPRSATRGSSPAPAAIRPRRCSRSCRSRRAARSTSSDIVIDAKSGVSGAGRGLKQNLLFTEAGEGLSPYSVGKHRHAPEIEQEISKAAGQRRRSSISPRTSSR